MSKNLLKNYKHFSLTVEDDIAWLNIDVKNEAANVISPEVVTELDKACDEVAKLNTKGLILVSGKSSGFIAGADVKKFREITDPDEARAFIQAGHATCKKLENLSMPTVAMVEGFCMGGGLEIALSCDYIIVDDAPSTKLSLPEVKLGIHPGFGGTVRSIRKIGVMQAMPMMLTGKNILPRQAKKMGLADMCVPIRQLKSSAIQLVLRKPAKKQAPKSARLLELGPMRKVAAMQMRKGVASKAKQEHYPAPYALINLWETHGSIGDDMFAAEAESVLQLGMTDTARNLARVFFLQNRLKSLGDKKLFSPKHVHVIGGGVMGGDIAAWCAMQGMKVTIQDISTDALGRVMGRATKGFKKRYRKDKFRIMQAQDNLSPDLHGHGIANADVIIEAIYENLEAKQGIFKDVEAKAKKDAIIATNTSSIPLSDIAKAMKKPQRLVGLHFFNPVFKMPLLEIVYTPKKTNATVIKQAQSFGAHINKLPLPVKSSPGFLVNRILMPYILEGVTAQQEGIPTSIVDKAAVDYGMPMGPLELADTVGLDICLNVGKILADTVGVTLPNTLDSEVAAGKLGKKSGEGFYQWKNGKKQKTSDNEWDGDMKQLQKRLIEKFTNESQKCIKEGIVEDADLLDAGAIFGTGFAPFRGGPMNALKESA